MRARGSLPLVSFSFESESDDGNGRSFAFVVRRRRVSSESLPHVELER